MVNEMIDLFCYKITYKESQYIHYMAKRTHVSVSIPMSLCTKKAQ